MANRTVKDAQTIKGTNPQYLIEKIIRTRIYDCKYWKEECFALTAELLVDKAMELRYVGGTYAGNIKPSNFLCLTLKMLQIQPEKDIIVEFIKNEDFKYVRALGAFYLRLVGTAVDCYKYLEPLLNDYRKIRMQKRDGTFELSHMDEFIDSLLRDERSCDVILPRISKRHILEENNDIEPRVSVLEDDLDNVDSTSEDDDDEPSRPPIAPQLTASKSSGNHDSKRPTPHKRTRSDRRSRSRSRERRRRSRSPPKKDRRDRSRDRGEGRRDRERERERGRRGDERREERRGGGGGSREEGSDSRKGGKDSMSVEETNKLRAQLGLAPLK